METLVETIERKIELISRDQLKSRDLTERLGKKLTERDELRT